MGNYTEELSSLGFKTTNYFFWAWAVENNHEPLLSLNGKVLEVKKQEKTPRLDTLPSGEDTLIFMAGIIENHLETVDSPQTKCQITH